jgi:hypothetical protein
MAAEYTAQALPGRICAALRSHTPLPDRPNLNDDQGYQAMISTLLVEEIEKFDREIGEAVSRFAKNRRSLRKGKLKIWFKITPKSSVEHIMVLRSQLLLLIIPRRSCGWQELAIQLSVSAS